MNDALRVVAEESVRASQYRKRNLRIAVRQLERAELYIEARSSLDADDEVAEESAARRVGGLRGLRRFLLARKASV